MTASKTALITIDPTSYLYPITEKALKSVISDISIVKDPSACKDGPVVHFGEYEELDFDRLMSDPRYLACSYIYRKGLIRKHFLANTIAVYTAKTPNSILKQAVPESFNIEVDYAEFLDDALDEVYELRCELEENATRNETERKTYIVKPSMSDRGQGIRLFQTIDGLQAIFDSFEEDETDEELEETDARLSGTGAVRENNIVTSQLRHFIVQDYVQDVLLLPKYDNRKFHIRTYVVVSGAIKVYVYKEMLALFALSPYAAPKEDDDASIALQGHLTNTCLQGESKDDLSVSLFWNLNGLSQESKQNIYNELCETTGELFKAAVGGGSIFFQPLPNAFEIYGVDFLVTADEHVRLLEVNAYPDFKQTGDELKGVIDGLFEEVAQNVVKPFFDPSVEQKPSEKLTLVLDQTVSGGW